MTTFCMNFYDLENRQFKLNGEYIKLTKKAASAGTNIRSLILFLLNIHRDRWVTMDDLIDYAYYDTNPDDWPDYQKNSILTTIFQIRKLLPSEVKIENQYYMGYRLTIKGDTA